MGHGFEGHFKSPRPCTYYIMRILEAVLTSKNAQNGLFEPKFTWKHMGHGFEGHFKSPRASTYYTMMISGEKLMSMTF